MGLRPACSRTIIKDNTHHLHTCKPRNEGEFNRDQVDNCRSQFPPPLVRVAQDGQAEYEVDSVAGFREPSSKSSGPAMQTLTHLGAVRDHAVRRQDNLPGVRQRRQQRAAAAIFPKDVRRHGQTAVKGGKGAVRVRILDGPS